MRRTGAFLLSLLIIAVSACATAGSPKGQWCEAPSRQDVKAPNAAGLAGRYDFAVKATNGEQSGRLALGVLELSTRDSASSVLLTLGGAPHPHLRELYFGSATIDLQSVGAYTEGSISSRDPAAPGVTIRAWTDRKNGQLQFRFGSNENRRDIGMLDGAFIDASILETARSGFRGRWEASLGHTSYRASGFFCGMRI